MNEELRSLATRLERLADPNAADGRFSWRRLWGRLFRTPRHPRIATERLASLLDRIEFGYPAQLQPSRGDPQRRASEIALLKQRAERTESSAHVFADALHELVSNISHAEQTSFVHGRLPDGHLDRLWRLYQVMYRASEWLEVPARRPLLRELICADARVAISPLTTDPAYGDPRPVRGVDAFIAAADAETRSIGRQRRLLEAARRQLLDAGAALRLAPGAARARRILITRRIARLDRLQAAGLSPDVDIGYQLREAMDRGELPRMAAALTALEEGALATGDQELRRLAEVATESLWRGRGDRSDAASQSASLRASQEQLFGARLRDLIDRAYGTARLKLETLRSDKRADPNGDEFFYNETFFGDWERYFAEGATQGTLAAAVAADGCFEVGATSSPARSAGEALRPVLVDYPQQEMVLEPVGGIHDVRNAVIGDPRRVLLDLAAGKLLARRYVGARPYRDGVPQLQNEVRVYVLDGSSSMLGPRARMRDALLLAELATLSARLQDPLRPGNPVLYYRYFNAEVGEIRRVATPEDAEAAVQDALGAVREGETNIQGALLASFEQIRLDRESDPDLARAQIVLVTDGEAAIDEAALRSAREDVGDIPVGVSIIALGAENPDLRALSARQRARGERVFYQFLDDDELWAIVDGDSAGLPMHLPVGCALDALGAEVRSVVADIERHLRRIDADEIARADEIATAFSEMGLSGQARDHRLRAPVAATHDQSTVQDAFGRAFPSRPGDGPAEAKEPPGAPMAEGPHTSDILVILATVADVIDSFGGRPIDRRADAVDLLERLLAEAHIPPWEYASLVRRPPKSVVAALAAVHVAAGAVGALRA